MENLVEYAGAHTASNTQISKNNNDNLNYLLLKYPCYVVLT